jgi:hypothetical protein
MALTLIATISVVGVVCGLAGCGQQEAERAAVQGRVTVQGQPVAEGNIAFFPQGETRGRPAGAEIVNGEYALTAEEGPLVGSARVEIQAFRKTGRKIPDLMGDVSQANRPLIEEKINTLPAKYNVNSKLVRQITMGENSLDFEL